MPRGVAARRRSAKKDSWQAWGLAGKEDSRQVGKLFRLAAKEEIVRMEISHGEQRIVFREDFSR